MVGWYCTVLGRDYRSPYDDNTFIAELQINTHILLLITFVNSGGSMYVRMYTQQEPQTLTQATVHFM